MKTIPQGETYPSFKAGQRAHGPGPEYVCVLQCPDARTETEARRTAFAIFRLAASEFTFVPGHAGPANSREYDRGILRFCPSGFMIFARKDHPLIDFLLA